jgi:hypothetical protein
MSIWKLLLGGGIVYWLMKSKNPGADAQAIATKAAELTKQTAASVQTAIDQAGGGSAASATPEVDATKMSLVSVMRGFSGYATNAPIAGREQDRQNRLQYGSK